MINLRPVMDYATTQAATSTGEVGSAYNAALRQFQSGTGITLDTAPSANSVLKGLNDLAGNYAPGSAAQRAVLDVKKRAEQSIFDSAFVLAYRLCWKPARPLWPERIIGVITDN